MPTKTKPEFRSREIENPRVKTADEWLSVYAYGQPLPTINEDTLTDIACPECGSRDAFDIGAFSIFKVYDGGTTEFGDVEWEPGSFCKCRNCGAFGSVSTFTFPGLELGLLNIKHAHSES